MSKCNNLLNNSETGVYHCDELKRYKIESIS